MERVKCPNPTPPIEARPTSLAVTDIEAWIRDPYALYAKHILRLQPLAPLEREADPMLKGTLYHAIMQDYIESMDFAKSTDERKKYLNALAQEHISEENLPEEISNIWTLRFHEIADAYIAWENEYLASHSLSEVLCEIDGSVKLVEDSFQLRARADRIDVMQDKALHIIDYKTGSNPSVKQAQTLSPQLALEGLIARMGGFAITGKADVANLSYMRLRSKNDFKNERIHNEKNSLDDIINNAEQELLKLIKGYQLREQGYISRRAPFKDGDISGDYDHLARTREWSFGTDDEGDE
jgi:ATP-dependent helicase/nuclease subunit B